MYLFFRRMDCTPVRRRRSGKNNHDRMGKSEAATSHKGTVSFFNPNQFANVCKMKSKLPSVNIKKKQIVKGDKNAYINKSTTTLLYLS